MPNSVRIRSFLRRATTRQRLANGMRNLFNSWPPAGNSTILPIFIWPNVTTFLLSCIFIELLCFSEVSVSSSAILVGNNFRAINDLYYYSFVFRKYFMYLITVEWSCKTADDCIGIWIIRGRKMERIFQMISEREPKKYHEPSYFWLRLLFKIFNVRWYFS